MTGFLLGLFCGGLLSIATLIVGVWIGVRESARMRAAAGDVDDPTDDVAALLVRPAIDIPIPPPDRLDFAVLDAYDARRL